MPSLPRPFPSRPQAREAKRLKPLAALGELRANADADLSTFLHQYDGRVETLARLSPVFCWCCADSFLVLERL